MKENVKSNHEEFEVVNSEISTGGSLSIAPLCLIGCPGLCTVSGGVATGVALAASAATG